MKGTKNRPVSTPRKGANARTPKLPQIPDLQEMDRRGEKLMGVYKFLALGVAVAGIGFAGGYISNETPTQTYEKPRSEIVYNRNVPRPETLSGLYNIFLRHYNMQIIQSEATELSNMIDNGSSGMDIKNNIEDFSRRSGSLAGLNALFIASMPRNASMPTGIEYEEYVKAYYEETGVNVSGLTLDELDGMLFTHNMDAAFFDPTSKIGIAMLATRYAGKALGPSDYDRHVDRWNRAQHYSGNIQTFINQTGRKPNHEELYNLSWQGASGAVREDKVRTIYGTPGYVNERRSGSAAGETVTREVPLDSPGDPRYATP